ncbi:MAG: hypothetical protein COB15_14830 [Flavobacteriales bacterium]|nr:MAG: hypothetical protein COB15_14830 [Flavobacteriales bacterium]
MNHNINFIPDVNWNLENCSVIAYIRRSSDHQIIQAKKIRLKSVVLGLENSSPFTGLSFYPNPTTGNFSIDLGETKHKLNLILTNSLGQVLFSKNYASTNFINLGINAPSGIYFLQLESDEESKTIRILKN